MTDTDEEIIVDSTDLESISEIIPEDELENNPDTIEDGCLTAEPIEPTDPTGYLAGPQ